MKIISITSADMDKQDPSQIPEEIFEYRTLSKEDLINKVFEARQEIAQLKNLPPPNEEDIKETTSKKDHLAKANELFNLRQIIKTLKNSPKKDKENNNELRTKDGESKTEQVKKRRGRPSKN